jgi:hypothetical protein
VWRRASNAAAAGAPTRNSVGQRDTWRLEIPHSRVNHASEPCISRHRGTHPQRSIQAQQRPPPAGVIETIAAESPVLQRLPFIEIVGNGLTYNRENSSATAAFYDVGDTWSENTPTFTQATATLRIMGGDADIDNFLKSTRSDIQDLEAAIVQLKARATQNLFDDTFINGDESADPKSFEGVDRLCGASQALSWA